jgi:hypothetical protein
MGLGQISGIYPRTDLNKQDSLKGYHSLKVSFWMREGVELLPVALGHQSATPAHGITIIIPKGVRPKVSL